MTILYLLIGIIASILGALPLGASNIAVINTSLKQNANQAIKIAITAGIAEVILSYYALHCNEIVKTFFYENRWFQITIALILFLVGLFLLLKKTSSTRPKKRRFIASKYATGFLLGILNPPVLIYWIITYGILNNNDFMLSLKSSFLVLFLFFSGVYIGKLFTLYFYSKISIIIKHRVNNMALLLNKITGLLLILVGALQSLKLYIL